MWVRLRIAEEASSDGIENWLHEVLHVQLLVGTPMETRMKPEGQGDRVMISRVPRNGAPNALDLRCQVRLPVPLLGRIAGNLIHDLP